MRVMMHLSYAIKYLMVIAKAIANCASCADDIRLTVTR